MALLLVHSLHRIRRGQDGLDRGYIRSLEGFLADDRAGVIEALRRLDELDPERLHGRGPTVARAKSMADASTAARCLQAPARLGRRAPSAASSAS
jgi:hypothetical protein